jgi:hypothetical protein
MDNAYRDALDAAQRRIQQLEAEREPVRKPKRTSVLWFVLPGAALLSMLLLAVGAIMMIYRPREEPIPIETSDPYVPEHKSYGVNFYPGHERLTLQDVDADGKKEMVSLFWKSGLQDDRNLYAGVIDRSSYEVRWMKGPYPSQWVGPHTHMVVVGQHMVVTDSRENLYVLNLTSGEEEHTLKDVGSIERLRKLPGSDSEIGLVQSGYPMRWKVLNLATGALREPKKSDDTERLKASPGELASDFDSTVSRRAKLKTFYTYGSSELLGSARFVQGSSKKESGSDDYLLMLDRESKAYRWEALGVIEEDALHPGARPRHLLTESSLVSFYQTKAGDFRLLARSNRTGEVLWKNKLADAKEGAYVADFFILDGDIHAFVDHKMHVIDLATGTEKHLFSSL